MELDKNFKVRTYKSELKLGKYFLEIELIKVEIQRFFLEIWIVLVSTTETFDSA